MILLYVQNVHLLASFVWQRFVGEMQTLLNTLEAAFDKLAECSHALSIKEKPLAETLSCKFSNSNVRVLEACDHVLI